MQSKVHQPSNTWTSEYLFAEYQQFTQYKSNVYGRQRRLHLKFFTCPKLKRSPFRLCWKEQLAPMKMYEFIFEQKHFWVNTQLSKTRWTASNATSSAQKRAWVWGCIRLHLFLWLDGVLKVPINFLPAVKARLHPLPVILHKFPTELVIRLNFHN